MSDLTAWEVMLKEEEDKFRKFIAKKEEQRNALYKTLLIRCCGLLIVSGQVIKQLLDSDAIEKPAYIYDTISMLEGEWKGIQTLFERYYLETKMWTTFSKPLPSEAERIITDCSDIIEKLGGIMQSAVADDIEALKKEDIDSLIQHLNKIESTIKVLI